MNINEYKGVIPLNTPNGQIICEGRLDELPSGLVVQLKWDGVALIPYFYFVKECDVNANILEIPNVGIPEATHHTMCHASGDTLPMDLNLSHTAILECVDISIIPPGDRLLKGDWSYKRNGQHAELMLKFDVCENKKTWAD